MPSREASRFGGWCDGAGGRLVTDSFPPPRALAAGAGHKAFSALFSGHADDI